MYLVEDKPMIDNYIARPIEYDNQPCETCSGNGELMMSKEEFSIYLYNLYCGYKGIVKEALFQYRQWKTDRTVTCSTCLGAGRIRTRRG